MFTRSLKCEFIKLKRNPIWAAFIIIPILSAIFGTFNFIMNQGILSLTWDSLWTQHTLFLCFFFLPALLGTFCACLWRPEFMHNTMNLLMTAPIPRYVYYITKLVIASAVSLLCLLWILLLFFVCGKFCNIPASFPPSFFLWVLYGFVSCITINSLQLFLSMVIRKFAVPIGISAIGGVLGLLFFAKGYSAYFPYSLLAYGMHANDTHMVVHFLPFISSCLFFMLIFTVLSCTLLTKKDVKA